MKDPQAKLGLVDGRRWDATLDDLNAVAVPQDRGHCVAVPYVTLVDALKASVSRSGFSIESEAFALTRSGKRMRGFVTCSERSDEDWSLIIGVRSSYDGSCIPGLVVGSIVLECGNIAFHDEVEPNMRRKQTLGLLRDLPDLMYEMTLASKIAKQGVSADIQAMSGKEMQQRDVDGLVAHAIAVKAITDSEASVVRAWYDDMRPEIYGDHTAWCLFNSFTAVMEDQPPFLQLRNTLRITKVFREAVANPN